MYNKDTRQPEKLRVWQSAGHPAKAGRSAAAEETAARANAATGVRIRLRKRERPWETEAAFLCRGGADASSWCKVTRRTQLPSFQHAARGLRCQPIRMPEIRKFE